MATSPVCAHACAPSPFRSDLPPDELAAISDLARSLRADVEEPFRALSVLHELLSKMDLEGTVPVWGLVSLMAPALSQLDEVRCTVSTLAHLLGQDGQRVQFQAPALEPLIKQLRRAAKISKDGNHA